MELDHATRLERLCARLQRVIDPAADDVRLYFLCQSCRDKIRTLGQGKVYRDESVYVL